MALSRFPKLFASSANRHSSNTPDETPEILSTTTKFGEQIAMRALWSDLKKHHPSLYAAINQIAQDIDGSYTSVSRRQFSALFTKLPTERNYTEYKVYIPDANRSGHSLAVEFIITRNKNGSPMSGTRYGQSYSLDSNDSILIDKISAKLTTSKLLESRKAMDAVGEFTTRYRLKPFEVQVASSSAKIIEPVDSPRIADIAGAEVDKVVRDFGRNLRSAGPKA